AWRGAWAIQCLSKRFWLRSNVSVDICSIALAWASAALSTSISPGRCICCLASAARASALVTLRVRPPRPPPGPPGAAGSHFGPLLGALQGEDGISLVDAIALLHRKRLD